MSIHVKRLPPVRWRDGRIARSSGTEVRFSMDESPSLTRNSGPAFQQIESMLNRLTPSEREAVLLNLCQEYQTP